MPKWSDYVVLTDPEGVSIVVRRKGTLLEVVVDDRQLFFAKERDGTLADICI